MPSPSEANTVYWKFTIMWNLRTGYAQRDGLVTEMDPDAVDEGMGRRSLLMI